MAKINGWFSRYSIVGSITACRVRNATLNWSTSGSTMLAFIVLLCTLYCDKIYAFLNGIKRQFQYSLRSFGDPDLSPNSALQRRMQELYRLIDNKFIFTDDPDTPGLTFTTPVEWAPWMETIWFGNAYDYRSAYFHDVMYSNNVPCREGALLYKNPSKATQIALVYQRYKKFDQSSYSVSNATFFNIFGAVATRIGRYKTPLTDDIILCVTDPLTLSEMKRYLNSFNVLKWFKSKFFQQKRKRQIPLKLTKDSADFFEQVVHFVEYGRVLDKVGGDKVVCLPIVPVVLPVDGGEEGLVVEMNVANSQYFMETLFQVVLSTLGAAKGRILAGGDGRVLNAYALETLLRVAAGNGVGSMVFGKDSVLTTAAAREVLADDASFDAALVLTAPVAGGGLRGSFGVRVVLKGGPGEEEAFWVAVRERMSSLREVRLVPRRPSRDARNGLSIGALQVSTCDAMLSYVGALCAEFDLDRIKEFLASRDVTFTVDTQHGAAGPAVRLLLEALGVDPEVCLLNGNMLSDFGGITPDLSLANSPTTVELFTPLAVDAKTVLEALQALAAGSVELEDVKEVSWIERPSDGDSSSPDFGFVLDADGSSCLVAGPNIALSPAEALAISAAPVDSRDGIRLMLHWLDLLAKHNAEEGKLIGPEALAREHWTRHGRSHSVVLELPLTKLRVAEVVGNLTELLQNTNSTWRLAGAPDVAVNGSLVSLSCPLRLTDDAAEGEMHRALVVTALDDVDVDKVKLSLCAKVTAATVDVSVDHFNTATRELLLLLVSALEALGLLTSADLQLASTL